MRVVREGLLACVVALFGAASLAGQVPAARVDTVALSLDEAVARALSESEEIRLARAQVELAETEITATRSQALPQLSANGAYTKTFASAFDTGEGFQLPDSLRFDPDTTASLAERVRYLERRVPTAGLGGLGQLFGDLPFGQENLYVAGLSGSQLLYAGGRVRAALGIARSAFEASRLNLAEEAAEIELQVRTAYVQAQLAAAFTEATEAALEQAESFLEQERLRLAAGQASELDVLRAQVDLENLRPQLTQARNAEDLALLNLKRLTDIPLGLPILLTTELAPPAGPAQAGVAPELLVAQRAAVLAAEERVEMAREGVRIARASYLPSVSLQSSYGRQLFPDDMFELSGDWRTDWTVTLGVQVPLFQGFRRSAEVERARVELRRVELQARQLREAVALQYEQALGEKRRAAEAIAGRQATVGMAERVYALTELRYEQGLATQLEVSAARLSLLQARTNLAQAVADFYIADAAVVRSEVGPGGGGPPRESEGERPSAIPPPQPQVPEASTGGRQRDGLLRFEGPRSGDRGSWQE